MRILNFEKACRALGWRIIFRRILVLISGECAGNCALPPLSWWLAWRSVRGSSVTSTGHLGAVRLMGSSQWPSRKPKNWPRTASALSRCASRVVVRGERLSSCSSQHGQIMEFLTIQHHSCNSCDAVVLSLRRIRVQWLFTVRLELAGQDASLSLTRCWRGWSTRRQSISMGMWLVWGHNEITWFRRRISTSSSTMPSSRP